MLRKSKIIRLETNTKLNILIAIRIRYKLGYRNLVR